MRHTFFRQLSVAVLAFWCAAPALAQTKGAALDRTVLPIPEPQLKPITELDARKAKAPARFEVKAPQGAPAPSPYARPTR